MSNRFLILQWVCLSVLFVASCKTYQLTHDHMGAYKLEDGRVISIRKSQDNTLRYRDYRSGDTGRLFPQDDQNYISGRGFSSKDPIFLHVKFKSDSGGSTSGLIWSYIDSLSLEAKSLNRKEWITFQNEDIFLYGRLDLPDGPGPYPAIILVHGSGDHAATDYYFNGDFFAANGIAALTFDKRGTGQSGGEYTFDYHKLANDVVAAVDYLTTRDDIDKDRIGLSGYSQGGWVAPLASTQTDKVKYAIINYGMIESAIEEARLETRNTMKARGIDAKNLDEIDELTVAAVKVVASNFKEGWDHVKELDKKYKGAPWRKKMKGTTVHQFLKYPKWLVKMIGPGKSPYELDWYYDSTELLDTLSMPMVWLLGGSDLSAPNELTIERLRQLQEKGKPFELKIFPKADHTMLLFDHVDGERNYTKYVPGYFKIEVESALRLSGLKGIDLPR